MTQLIPESTGNISSCLSAHSTAKLWLTRSQLRENLPMGTPSALDYFDRFESRELRPFLQENSRKTIAGGALSTVRPEEREAPGFRKRLLARRVRGEILCEVAGQLVQTGVHTFLQSLDDRSHSFFRDRFVGG